MNDEETMRNISLCSLLAWMGAWLRYFVQALPYETIEGDVTVLAGFILLLCLVLGWLVVFLRNWT